VTSVRALFINLQGRLDGGEFSIQTEKSAIYLPPGCTHSTVTLSGGLTLGITFTTSECLNVACAMWDLERVSSSREKDDCLIFLSAVIRNLESGVDNQKKQAGSGAGFELWRIGKIQIKCGVCKRKKLCVGVAERSRGIIRLDIRGVCISFRYIVLLDTF